MRKRMTILWITFVFLDLTSPAGNAQTRAWILNPLINY